MALKKLKDIVEIKADAAAVEKAVKETAKKAEKKAEGSYLSALLQQEHWKPLHLQIPR